jgi:transposase-like protein
MTSRTNGPVRGQHLGGTDDVTPSPLEQRRHLAVQRYLAGDLIETICQEMGCSKSWLYKWKQRYQATDPTWVQERSRRPQTTPTQTPESIATEIRQLRQTLSADGTTTVSARVIQEHLSLHPTTALPALRTIYRILKRQSKKGAAHSVSSSRVDALAFRVGQLQAPSQHEANGAPRHMSR